MNENLRKIWEKVRQAGNESLPICEYRDKGNIPQFHQTAMAEAAAAARCVRKRNFMARRNAIT